MAFDKCWNVEKYKSEYESEEHWELRKKFMVTHKEKFSEDKLVCLARVFFNVEFLGCRYPEKTMQLVAELSKGVADEHREKQKGKLKRTFVQASDAAGARIKGAPPLIEPQNKMLKTAIKESSSATSSVYSCFVHEELVKPQTSKVSGPYSDFIIFISCNFMNQKQTCPIVILEQSAAKSSKYKNIKFEFPPEKNKGYERYCEVLINDKVLASSKGRTNKEAKENAAAGGLYILRKTCYTIETKYRILSQTPAIQKDSSEPQTTEALPQDNIGTKMLQKMGWSGSGLGKNQQGIKAPIKPTCQIMQRAGLGFDDNNDLRKKFKTFFYGYKASDTDADVVFASDFSKSERKTLHWNEEGTEEKNEDKLKDLFDLDFKYRCDEDYENTSDEECIKKERKRAVAESKCPLCCKLETLTGEETYDDVYDIMWGTSSDTTAQVRSTEDCGRFIKLNPGEENDDEETDGDEVCDMDVSDNSQDGNTDNDLARKNSQEEISGGNTFSHTTAVRTLSNPHQSSQTTQNANLNEKLVTELETITGKTQNTRLVGVPQPASQALFHKSIPESLRYIPSRMASRVGLKKIQMFVPDGSFFRICLKFIKLSKVLNQFVFPYGDRPLQGLRINITEEDLKRNPELWDNLVKYSICRKFPDGTSIKMSDNSNLSWSVPCSSSEVNDGIVCLKSACVHSRGNESVHQQIESPQNPFPSKNIQLQDWLRKNTANANKETRRSSIQFIFPDGSFKNVTIHKIESNEELTKFIQYAPSKPNQKLNCIVTDKDLRTNKAIRELYYNFVFDKHMHKSRSNSKDNNADDYRMQPVPDHVVHGTSTAVPFNNKPNSSNLFAQILKVNKVDLSTIKICQKSANENLKSFQTKTCTETKTQSTSNSLFEQASQNAKYIVEGASSSGQMVISVENKPLQSNTSVKNDLEKNCIVPNQIDSVPKTHQEHGLKKVRIFLPDGSFKSIPISDLEKNKELEEFTKHSFHATIEDLRNNRALREFFSDFLKPYLLKRISESGTHYKSNTFTGEDLALRHSAGETSRFRSIELSNSDESTVLDTIIKPVELNQDGSERKTFVKDKNLTVCNSLGNATFTESNCIGHNLTDELLSSPKSNPNISHLQFKEDITNLFKSTTASTGHIGDINDSLHKHLLEPGADSSILNLENHINSSAVTTVHSSAALPSTLGICTPKTDSAFV